MVSKDTKNHLHALLLQRLNILLLVLQALGDVLIVVVIHLLGLWIVVDISREEDHLVKEILATVLKCKA